MANPPFLIGLFAPVWNLPSLMDGLHASIKMGSETQQVAKRNQIVNPPFLMSLFAPVWNPSSLMNVLQFGREKVTKFFLQESLIPDGCFAIWSREGNQITNLPFLMDLFAPVWNPSSLMDVLQFGRKKGLNYTNPSVLMGSSAHILKKREICNLVARRAF